MSEWRRKAVIPAAGVVVGGCVFAALIAAVRHTPHLAPEAIISATTLAVALAPIARRVAGHFDLFEPIVPASAVLAALFGARPLMMIYDDDLTYFGRPIADRFPESVVLGLIATVFFVVGYEVWVSRPLARERVRSDAPSLIRAKWFALGSLAASILLFGAHLARGPSFTESLRLLARGRSNELADIYERSSEYFSSAPVLAASGAITVLAIAAGPRLSWPTRLLVAASVAFPAGIFLLVGARRFVIPAILVPVIVWYLRRGRRPRGAVVAVVLPLAFLLLATVAHARSAGAREEAGGVMPVLLDGLLRPDRTVVRFLRRSDTEMIAAFAAQLEMQSEPRDFFYGRASLGDLLLAPVPSAIVSSKPTTARDEMLIRVFGHPCRVRTGEGGGCADFSAIGTFYQDFWYLGVIVGMALLGVLSATLWRAYVRAQTAPTIVLAATWAVFAPIVLRAGFMPATTWWLYFVLPSLAGVWLAGRRSVVGSG
jgi:hypothetical protein